MHSRDNAMPSPFSHPAGRSLARMTSADTGPPPTDLPGRIDPRGWGPHPGVRSGTRLTIGERAAEVVLRAAGSWTYLAALTVAIAVAVATVVGRDDRAGPVALLSLVLSALALLEVSLVLMAARRAERTTTEAALYDLDQGRRATAVAEDLRGEVQRLHADLARIAAQAERSARRET
jgi:uncharacterized membrane protein